MGVTPSDDCAGSSNVSKQIKWQYLLMQWFLTFLSFHLKARQYSSAARCHWLYNVQRCSLVIEAPRFHLNIALKANGGESIQYFRIKLFVFLYFVNAFLCMQGDSRLLNLVFTMQLFYLLIIQMQSQLFNITTQQLRLNHNIAAVHLKNLSISIYCSQLSIPVSLLRHPQLFSQNERRYIYPFSAF